MTDLYAYTCRVIGAMQDRLRAAVRYDEVDLYGTPAALSETAAELIENLVEHLASDRLEYAPYIVDEAQRLLQNWCSSGWTNFDGEGYLADDDAGMQTWRAHERELFAEREGLR